MAREVQVIGMAAGYFLDPADGRAAPNDWIIRVRWPDQDDSTAWTISRPTSDVFTFFAAFAQGRLAEIRDEDIPEHDS